MKNYKETREYIGSSDIACVIAVGPSTDPNATGLNLKEICFGEDGDYHAWIIDEMLEVPEHYRKVAEFRTWLKIYDDNGLVWQRYEPGAKFEIYRAGDFGCLIRAVE